MKILKLTKDRGKDDTVYVNFDHVKLFYAWGKITYVEVGNIAQDALYVLETPEQILELLQEKNNENS